VGRGGEKEVKMFTQPYKKKIGPNRGSVTGGKEVPQHLLGEALDPKVEKG